MSPAAIEIQGLVKVHQGPPAVRAVDGIDLEVTIGMSRFVSHIVT